ncbi:MAG TPA: hypothetical protein VIU64_04765, partial [Polyangia bacterium]
NGGSSGETVWPTSMNSCMNPFNGVSVEAFCDYYDMKCSADYGSGTGMFADKADCMTKYTGYTSTQKGCTAYHLCMAGTSAANATMHCPHPAGGGGNPCSL